MLIYRKPTRRAKDMKQSVKSWIGANEIIAGDREQEIYAELNSGINLKYQEFIRIRDEKLKKSEQRLALQREKLRLAALRKAQENLEPKRSA